MMDTLDFLAESIDHTKVQAEQFPPLEVLVLEAFSGEAHRAMLLDHEWQIAKFREQLTPRTDDLMGDHRLFTAHAESEGWLQRMRAREAAARAHQQDHHHTNQNGNQS